MPALEPTPAMSVAGWIDPAATSFDQVAADYIAAGITGAARKGRRLGVLAFRGPVR